MKCFNVLLVLIMCGACYAEQNPTYTDVLNNPEHWVVEQQPGGEVNFKENSIEISLQDNYTTYSRDGEEIYHIFDSEPYRAGYFGFRTVDNRMEIENFTVSKLDAVKE